MTQNEQINDLMTRLHDVQDDIDDLHNYRGETEETKETIEEAYQEASAAWSSLYDLKRIIERAADKKPNKK